MFEAFERASPQHRYTITWLNLPEAQFNTSVNGWLQSLTKSYVFGGPSSGTRTALCEEFMLLLMIYDDLMDRRAKDLNVPVPLTSARRIEVYKTLHRTHFKTDPLPEFQALIQARLRVQRLTDELWKKIRPFEHKLRVLDRKLAVLDYWLHGVHHFNDHLEDVPLHIQYLHCAPKEKVRLIMEVLVSDASKVAAAPDPTSTFQCSAESGLQTNREVTWTEEEFKIAVKAEASASYGFSGAVECSMEVSGLKASAKGEAFVGARATASGEASYDAVKRELNAKGEVEVMVGVKLDFTAEIDCADIFGLEVGASAFAGAMAGAKGEFTIGPDEVSGEVFAEAFAGARVTGSAKYTFKMGGYEIMSIGGEGSLTAGVGASAGLKFKASTMGGFAFGAKAGVTVGLGAEGEAEVEFTPENLQRAVDAYYYRIYLLSVLSGSEYHAYFEYFRELEDNELLLKKAKEHVEGFRTRVVAERNNRLAEDAVLGDFARLAEKELLAQHRPPIDRKSTRLNSSHSQQSRMPSSA